MKKLLLLLSGVVSAFAANAQLPKWVLPPTCDTIFVKVDEKLLQTMNHGESSLLTMDGKKLYSTDHQILPYKEGVATIIDPLARKIVGLVDIKGNFKELPDVGIAFDNPYFEDGILTAISEGKIAYFRDSGNKVGVPFAVMSYPFHRGYAPYLTYDQIEKRKDPHYGYYKANGGKIHYTITRNGETKDVDPKNIEFLSGIGSNGKGVGVINGRLYWFLPETETFEPFLWGDDSSEKKRHLSLAAGYEGYFTNLPTDSVLIQAKYGKNQLAYLTFDNELVPKSFTFDDGGSVQFPEKKSGSVDYTSKIYGYKDTGSGLYGIAYNNKKVLPAQFQNVGLKYGDNAFVKQNGKWGILKIVPGMDFTLKMNKGENVPFRHQKYETQVRLDFPAAISAKDARIEIPENTGCVLDKTSRVTKDTDGGNFVTYDCVLNIPDSLSDEMVTVTYKPVSVTYDGFRLFDDSISVKAWHFKHYNVDPIESETAIADGVATFTVNVNYQKNSGERDYHFNVFIEADSVIVESEKLSETRYKYLVSNLQEGANSLSVIVQEDGCPPSSFPFELFYTKPKPKEKNKKEEVKVIKKPAKKEKPSPRLPI